METYQTDPPERSKEKLDTQAQGTTEVPPPRDKRKDLPEGSVETPTTKTGSQGTTETQQRKKQKTSKPTLNTALTDDDYELIATRTCDTLKDSLDAMKGA